MVEEALPWWWRGGRQGRARLPIFSTVVATLQEFELHSDINFVGGNTVTHILLLAEVLCPILASASQNV